MHLFICLSDRMWLFHGVPVFLFFFFHCIDDNHFIDADAEKKALFYQYVPTYTADEAVPFMQCYLFDEKK